MNSSNFKFPEVENFIDGKFSSNKGKIIEIKSPLNKKVISHVGISTSKDLDEAVKAAGNAFSKWSKTTIKDRVVIFHRYKNLLEKHKDEIAGLIHEENGKTIQEAIDEVDRAIDLIEFAFSLPQLTTGELFKESEEIEYSIERKPIGIVASIAPFNFPFALPHFTIPNALVLGNCLILKPSKQVPISSFRIAMLLKEAGLPDGVFNVVNGDKDVVEAICDHPQIAAVSFIGSSKVAKLVYSRSTSNFKRCLALGGSKNHTILLPDALPEISALTIAKALCECAGQRCLSPAVLVAVGEVDAIIKNIVKETQKYVPGFNMGPVISFDAKEKIIKYINEAEKDGATILIDGRVNVDHMDGFYIGPTVIDYARPEMKIAREEVFGPVLTIIRVNDINSAIKIVNSSSYGNTASVFTQNESIASHVMESVDAGMIGVNICIPSHRNLFSFGGLNNSKFGVCDINGKSSIEFWTILKKTYKMWKS